MPAGGNRPPAARPRRAPVVEHLTRSGDLLFRWRSYLPLALLPLLAVGLLAGRYPLHPRALDRAWEIGCALIAAAGVALRMYTVGTAAPGTSGRNTREQKAVELNTTGAYSVVRHPLYVANYLIALGIGTFTRAWFVPVILSLAAALYYERIAAREEEFLAERFGAGFRAWAARVPAIIPAFGGFRPAALPFRWRVAVVRESYAVATVTTFLFALALAEDYVATGHPRADAIWTTLFVLGGAFFVTIRALKKWTRFFATHPR
jgi:protein-S-isoprenylcysteine O-methyltransferase Ste14